MIVGAFATYAATSATERARWQRTQEVRWDDKRLAVYVDYAHSVKRVISLSVRIAAYRDVYPLLDQLDRQQGRVDRLDPEDARPALINAEEERTMKWEAVLLLGTDQTVLAARAWHESVFEMQRIAIGESNADKWPEAVENVSRSRRKFYECAKRDIGIPIGDIPESYEWQLSKYLKAQRREEEL